MALIERTLRLQRTILSLTVAGAAVVFWRATYDVFNTVKVTWIVVGVIVLLAIGAVRVNRTRRLTVPRTRLWWALGAFTVLLLLATVTSQTPMRSFVGDPGRHTGAAAYLAYVILMVFAVRLHLRQPANHLAVALVLASVPVAVYALAQAADVGPFDWQAVEGGPQVVSSFGNADFLAAWLGITVPLAVWLVLRPGAAAWSRWAGAAAAALAYVAGLATGSLQGAIVAPSGTAVVLAAWAWTHPGEAVRRWRGPVAVLGAILAVAVATLAVTGAGPFSQIQANLDRSLETRTGKWAAGLDMIADQPLLGVGLDAYGDHFHAYRSQELATESGLRRTVDDPHDVPLAMFTGGGVPLGAAYLAIVVGVALAAWRGLRRTDASDHLLVAAIAGAWLAYQLQSLVSIDVPPVAVLQWVLGGVLVARGSRPDTELVALPGAPPLHIPKGKKPSKARPVPLRRANPVLVTAIGVVGLMALALATWPLRADLAAGRARDLAARGDVDAAVDAYADAASVATWEGQYSAFRASVLAEAGRTDDARIAIDEATAREPRDLANVVNRARLLVAAGRIEDASATYERVLQLDPSTPEIVAEVGRFHLEHGDPDRAVELLAHAVEERPDETSWQALLTQARQAAS
ncbi:MAG: tetratricopeptide repeat protein [Actinobacteria bacterium]|nr:tetratricopeptide repeat protein [Actinomycetota bacterium]